MKTLDKIKQCPRLTIAQTTFDGGAGFIQMPGWQGTIVWSYGGGWDHVSVAPRQRRITPSWEDMCMIKDIFFNDDEMAVQYHPHKDVYVNNLENCLHLWRPHNEHELLTPPSIMGGIRDGQTPGSIKKEIGELM